MRQSFIIIALSPLALITDAHCQEAPAAASPAVQQEAAAAPSDERFRIYAAGEAPTRSPASNFAGTVIASSRFQGTGDSRLRGATVTFEKGAHTNWHNHPLGQLLIVTAGRGWVQAEGQPVRSVAPGDVIWTGPGVRHWHGATTTSSMTHVGVTEALNGKTSTWFEPLTPAEYRGPGK